jgi:RNase P/RNase MRP subunit POP5
LKRLVNGLPRKIEKKRYLLVDAKFDGDAARLVDEAVQEFLGELGASKARVVVKSTNPLVVKCARGTENEVIAALALKKEFEGKTTVMRTFKVSGTLKALTK